MIRSIEELRQWKIRAIDGDLGRVHDVYFRDDTWAVRYLVVDGHRWLSDRPALVPPALVEEMDSVERALCVTLTQAEIRERTGFDADRPVSGQGGTELAGDCGLSHGWLDWPPREVLEPPCREQLRPDPHLRSTRDTRGYRIQTVGGPLGHVEDFLIEDESWGVRYLLVDLRSWWPGKIVLVACELVERVDSEAAAVHAGLPRDAIRYAPAYDPSEPIHAEYERRLHNYYSRPDVRARTGGASGIA
jgi:hypothetical protein